MTPPTSYDRLEWFLRAPVHHVIWTICLVVGFLLSRLKLYVLRRPVLEGRYEALARERENEFEDRFHQEALRVVTASLLRESDIRDFVSIMPWRAMVERKRALEREVRLGRCLSRRPPAVFVIGLPRTGSTLLHQLCGLNPSGRVLRAYELKFPFDHHDANTKAAEKTQKMLNAFYFLAPRIKSVHFIKATDPDECVQGFVDCAVPEWVSWGAVDASTAYRWYVEGDMTPQYVNYEKMIRCIMSKDPDEGRGYSHLMLKSPHHTWKLPEIARAFPEAQFVWLHRDPVSSVASCASMNEAILDVSCSHFFDSRQLGRRTCERLAAALEKATKDRGVLEAEGRRFVDVYYPDLKRDALETMRVMYSELGLPPLTPLAEEAILTFLRTSNENMERNAHRYSLEHFGLTEADVRRRFAAYLERFPGLRAGSS